MTFDDDFVRLHFDGGTKNIPCKSINMHWPPPEKINVMGFVMVRSHYSEITDEERETMTHVCRGAEYYPEIQEEKAQFANDLVKAWKLSGDAT